MRRTNFFLIFTILIVTTIPTAIAFSGSEYEWDEDWKITTKLLEPHSIVFDSNDNFYLSDSGEIPGKKSVLKFSNDGKIIKKFIVEKPFAMTIDSNDNLYVENRIGSDYVIDKITGEGELLGRYEKSNGYAIGVRNSLAIDSNDNLIIKSGDILQKIDSDGKVMGTWDLSDILGIGKVGSGNIAIDSEDNLYFIEKGVGKITKIDSNLDYLFDWTVSKPEDMILGSDDTLFVSSGFPSSIVGLYSAEGEGLGDFRSGSNSIYRYFVGLDLDSKDNVYVVDKNIKTVTKFLKKSGITQNQENEEITSIPITKPQIDPPTLELDSGSDDASIQRIPAWAKNIFIWYGEDKVSENELINAIKYLLLQNIIKLD